MGFKLRDYSKPIPMDETHLLSRWEHFWFSAEKHRGAVLGGLGLLCVSALGLGLLIWHGQSQEEQAWELQAQAAKLYIDRPLDDPEKIKEHLDQAIALYRNILEEFPNTTSAELANYFIGNALVDQNEIKDAIESYQRYIDHYGQNKFLLGLVYQRLGYAYLMNGEEGKALDAFSKVLASPKSLNKDQALFEIAKIEEGGEKCDQALAHYKKLITEFPASPFLGEARIRVNALDPKSQKSIESEEPEGGT